MGVTLRGKYKRDYSSIFIQMSYAAFFRLRCDICRNFSLMLYEHYITLPDVLISPSEDTKKLWDNKLDRIVEKQALDEGRQKMILNFLFESDCSGKASYGTCKKILVLLQSEPEDKIIGRFGGSKATMKDLKELLIDVYTHKGKLIWN